MTSRTEASAAPLPAFSQTNDSRFASWLAGLRDEAIRAGVDVGTAEQALGSVEQVPRVLELARNQPEFKMTFERYMEIVAPEERVKLLRERRDEEQAVAQAVSNDERSSGSGSAARGQGFVLMSPSR